MTLMWEDLAYLLCGNSTNSGASALGYHSCHSTPDKRSGVIIQQSASFPQNILIRTTQILPVLKPEQNHGGRKSETIIITHLKVPLSTTLTVLWFEFPFEVSLYPLPPSSHSGCSFSPDLLEMVNMSRAAKCVYIYRADKSSDEVQQHFTGLF